VIRPNSTTVRPVAFHTSVAFQNNGLFLTHVTVHSGPSATMFPGHWSQGPGSWSSLYLGYWWDMQTITLFKSDTHHFVYIHWPNKSGMGKYNPPQEGWQIFLRDDRYSLSDNTICHSCLVALGKAFCLSEPMSSPLKIVAEELQINKER
jgi:hypothetical protein